MVLTLVTLSAKAQFVDSMGGLLLMPNAEMNPGGTFMITNNFLNKHYTSNTTSAYGWDYHTFGYGFSITFWSRLEIGYICTIFNGDWNPHAVSYRQKIMKNQDRHFAARVQVLKEEEFGWKWMPSIVLGVSDPVSNQGNDYLESDVSSGNGFFNRYYIAASKHFSTKWGEVGGHLTYQYTPRKDFVANGICAAVSWKPCWLENRWFYPNFVLEYDARHINFGFISSIWDDRFEAMFCLQNFQWVSFGLRFKLRLKGSE